MCEVISFRERVKNAAIKMAKVYKRALVNKEYLIFSKSFTSNKYYILSSTETNYLHLLGVHSTISPREFYNKCINKTLEVDDFDFVVNGRSEKEVKGSVRRKITALEEIDKIISKSAMVEESFNRNRVSCAIATANKNATLGFSGGKKSRPKTLMKGYELTSKAVKPDLILSRKRGAEEFDKIIVGNKNIVQDFLKSVDGSFKIVDSLR